MARPSTSASTSKNTGRVAGSEVVQIYINDVQATLDKPVKELKALKKGIPAARRAEDCHI